MSSYLQLNTELGTHAALGPRLAQEEREAREQALLVGGAGAEPGPPAPPGPLPAPTSPARDSAAAAKASLHQGPSQGWARGLEGPWGSGPAGTVPGQPPAHTPPPSCPSPPRGTRPSSQAFPTATHGAAAKLTPPRGPCERPPTSPGKLAEATQRGTGGAAHAGKRPPASVASVVTGQPRSASQQQAGGGGSPPT